MAYELSYTDARANLAELMDRVTKDREVVIIRRRGREDVALVSAAELEGIAETAHLLRSPKNRQRLLAAIKRARGGKGRPQNMEKLKREVGLGEEG